ncbi:MAG: Transcriptional regulator, HxlR family [Patescibacteria group bacterium]|nr:Transcriptional regulator, HxlR family [Patescibacteria group bacterium]
MNEFDKECTELKGALDILGDRWSAVILWSINERPRRFGEIQKSVQGINSRTLTQRLQALEDEGLITRHEFKEYPPRTEYRITPKGVELEPVFTAMMAWAQKHVFKGKDLAE